MGSQSMPAPSEPHPERAEGRPELEADVPTRTGPPGTISYPAADHAPQAAPPATDAAPPPLPGYQFLKRLGRGGMGVVYLAEQVRLKRLVAIKMVLAGPHADGMALNRFRLEAEAVARLAH